MYWYGLLQLFSFLEVEKKTRKMNEKKKTGEDSAHVDR